MEIIERHIYSGKEEDFSERMLFYYMDIWREYRKKIFAMALFIDDVVEWRIPISDTFHMEFIGTSITYKYHLRKSKTYNYRDYLDNDNPITAALMTRMDFGRDSRALVKAEALKKLKKYHLNPLQEEILRNFIDRLLFLSDNEEQEFKEIIYKEDKFKEVGEMLTTWEEKAMEKGELNKSINIAKKALAKGYDIEEISDLTGLSVEEIQKLIDEK